MRTRVSPLLAFQQESVTGELAKRLAVLILALLLMPSIVYAQTPEATPVRERNPGCRQLRDYRETVVQGIDDALTDEEEEVYLSILGRNPSELRPSELRTGSAAFDKIAAAIEDIPPSKIPAVVQPFRQAAIDYYGALASVLNALAEASPTVAVTYQNAALDARAEMREARHEGHMACGNTWSQNIWNP